MAIGTGFDTVGGVVVQDHSGAFLDALEKKARTAMTRVGTKAVNRAKAAAPVGATRRLVDGIGKTIERKTTQIILRVGGRDQKTHLHEFGTVKMKRNPFLTDATKDMGADLDAEMAKELEKLSKATEGK